MGPASQQGVPQPTSLHVFASISVRPSTATALAPSPVLLPASGSISGYCALRFIFEPEIYLELLTIEHCPAGPMGWLEHHSRQQFLTIDLLSFLLSCIFPLGQMRSLGEEL